MSQQGEPARPRPGKEVYTGTLEHDIPGGESGEKSGRAPLTFVYRLILALGAIAYNLLRAIDWRATRFKNQWPKHLQKKGAKLTRRRVGSIIRDIIQIASRIVSHAGKKEIKIASGWPWSRVIIGIDWQLC